MGGGLGDVDEQCVQVLYRSGIAFERLACRAWHSALQGHAPANLAIGMFEIGVERLSLVRLPGEWVLHEA